MVSRYGGHCTAVPDDASDQLLQKNPWLRAQIDAMHLQQTVPTMADLLAGK